MKFWALFITSAERNFCIRGIYQLQLKWAYTRQRWNRIPISSSCDSDKLWTDSTHPRTYTYSLFNTLQSDFISRLWTNFCLFTLLEQPNFCGASNNNSKRRKKKKKKTWNFHAYVKTNWNIIKQSPDLYVWITFAELH